MRVPRRAALLDAALFVGVSVLTRAVALGIETVDLDESSHLVSAWVLRAGGRLYVDAADHKPPLVFLYYALSQVFGHGMLSVRLLTDLFWVPLTAFVLSRVFDGEAERRAAGVAFLLASVSFFGHDTLAVNTEVLGLLPLACALLCVRTGTALTSPPRLLGAGAAIGLACLFRYQLGVALPALALGTWAATPSWRARATGWLALAVGFVVPEVIAWASFAARGTGTAYLYWNFAHNATYVASGLTLGEAWSRAIRYLVPVLLLLAPLIVVFWKGRRHLERPVAVVQTWLALGVAVAGCLGWRFYPHYFIPLTVPLALGAAPLIATWCAPRWTPAGRRLMTYGVVVVVAQTAITAALYAGRAPRYQEARPVFAHVASWLRNERCAETGRLFVWGYAPMFYTATGMLPASRFLYVDNTLVGHVSGHRGLRPELIRPDHWDLLMQDLETKTPAVILDASSARLGRWSVPMDAHPRFKAFVDLRYEPVAVVDRVAVYRRRTCRT